MKQLKVGYLPLVKGSWVNGKQEIRRAEVVGMFSKLDAEIIEEGRIIVTEAEADSSIAKFEQERVDAVIVHKGAVHIDNDFIANKYIFPVFAMEIDVNVYPLAHASEQFPQQGLPAIRVGIVRSMQHSQQTPCTQSHFRNFGIPASVERLTTHALFKFGLHCQKF